MISNFFHRKKNARTSNLCALLLEAMKKYDMKKFRFAVELNFINMKNVAILTKQLILLSKKDCSNFEGF